jgi:hypothetical protein
MLNEMVLCEELFHTPSGVAFADFVTNLAYSQQERDAALFTPLWSPGRQVGYL